MGFDRTLFTQVSTVVVGLSCIKKSQQPAVVLKKGWGFPFDENVTSKDAQETYNEIDASFALFYGPFRVYKSAQYGKPKKVLLLVAFSI